MAVAEKGKKDGKEENEGAEKAPEKKTGSALKGIIVGVVISIALGGGGAAAYFLLAKSSVPADGKKPVEQAKTQITTFYSMEPFIVNLIDNEGERYLKVVMQLELSDLPVVEELNLVKPKLRDAILDLLSAKTYKEMMDPLGKQRLREEIVMWANKFPTKGKVIKVYFTEFIIQ